MKRPRTDSASERHKSQALACARRFRSDLEHVRHPMALHAVLETAAGTLGFDYFALVEHRDPATVEHLICLQSYPPGWSDAWQTDPVIAACDRTGTAFRWDELPQLTRLGRAERAFLGAAREAGLQTGVTVPSHLPGYLTLSCTFASRHLVAVDDERLLAIELVGAAACEAGRALIRLHRHIPDAPPRLSSRQRDCLILAGKGKTDWEIATILDLSEETVTKYLNAARVRYGVSRRIQLALRAVWDGQISLAELIRP
jgi:LuxR family transcriptional regulator, quorum-sensing system regulator CciR